MSIYKISLASGTGSFALTSHFNTNLLPYANTGETPWGGNDGNEFGSITEETLEALEQFDIDHTRFPAGQEKTVFSEHGIIVDGDLSPFLDTFLSEAQAMGMKVNLVVPVESLERFGGVSADELYAQLELMAEIIAGRYPQSENRVTKVLRFLTEKELRMLQWHCSPG